VKGRFTSRKVRALSDSTINKRTQAGGCADAYAEQDSQIPDNPEKKKKQTIAEFLAAAAEMEECDWENKWDRACKRFASSAREFMEGEEASEKLSHSYGKPIK